MDVLRDAHNLNLKLNSLGPDGQISFAKACIWFGMEFSDEIIAEASAIGGDHLEARFENILMEGEGIHWTRCSDGRLQLLLS